MPVGRPDRHLPAGGQRCAWAIDVPLEGAAAELDFDARGRRALALGLLEVELPGELDPAERRVRVVLDGLLLSPWVTVTAFDSQERVLGVSRTQWTDIVGPGEIERELELPRPPDEVARYEVRVGGLHHESSTGF